MSAILLALIQAGLVPEIMAFVRDHFTQTGWLPTDEQVKERCLLLATSIIRTGEEYLATHPKEVAP